MNRLYSSADFDSRKPTVRFFRRHHV